MNSSSTPAVFFDRDGTLMDEVHYCADPRDVRIIPGADQALSKLRRSGFQVVIVTNQSGIGRGLITEIQYRAVHAELLRQLGNQVDAAYFCADTPDAATGRRKPSPGMIEEAVRDLGLDLGGSWMVGDKAIDIECAHRAGIPGILVRTGYGRKAEAAPPGIPPFAMVDDVADAVDLILGSPPAHKTGLPGRLPPPQAS